MCLSNPAKANRTGEASKSYFGQPLCEAIIAGDINGDCRVDMTDLEVLMRHWLQDESITPGPTIPHR